MSREQKLTDAAAHQAARRELMTPTLHEQYVAVALRMLTDNLPHTPQVMEWARAQVNNTIVVVTNRDEYVLERGEFTARELSLGEWGITADTETRGTTT